MTVKEAKIKVQRLRLKGRILELRCENIGFEERFNPYHDPVNGRFTTSDGGGMGGVLYSKGGKSAYVFDSKNKIDKNASLANGFNGQEHAVQVDWDDGTTFVYRIKGTQMYKEASYSNKSILGGDNELYDVPVNQAEIIVNNAKNNGVKAKVFTPEELKKRDADIIKARIEDDKNLSVRHTSKGINRHRNYWSAM